MHNLYGDEDKQMKWKQRQCGRGERKKKSRNNRRDNTHLCLRLCKCARLCGSSVSLALCLCLNGGAGGGGDIHFKEEAERISVQLQKYEASVSTTNPGSDPPQAKPATFISPVIWLFVLVRRWTQKVNVMFDWGKSGKKRQRFCSAANHKAPWWLFGIHSFRGAELCGSQIGAWLNSLQYHLLYSISCLCLINVHYFFSLALLKTNKYVNLFSSSNRLF